MKIRGQKVIEPQLRIRRMSAYRPLSECWEWQGSTRCGYGRLTVGSRTDGTRKTESAHRYSYAVFNGEIPSGMYVCHRCDNPLCVNPDHLFLGTHQDNVDDRERKGRNKPKDFGKHEDHPKAKLTCENVAEIRNAEIYRGYIRDLAKRFNVNHKTISDIVNYKTWIPQPPESD